MTRTKLDTEVYTLPTFLASYLVNGDSSGLDDAAKIQADEWLNIMADGRKLFYCVSMSEESHFAWHNDFHDGRLGCEVAKFTFLVNAVSSLRSEGK